MNPVAITVATLTLTLTLISHVTCFPYLHGGLRAEDGIPLDTVASDLSDRLTKMTAQLQAQDVLITDLKTRLANVLTPAVVFTATFSRVDIRGLDDQQVLKFDKVLTNVGQGYSPDTGLFTAPEHGTYIFNVHVARHPSDTHSCVEVDLYRGLQHHVTTASSCAINDTRASKMAAFQLEKGDTVHVQMRSGDLLLGNLHTSMSAIKV
ncbi:complement C1q-like protein 3 [Littorina saxatilis]|uniref:complement C1q-like protein 3 n=1 Tax=Littorina saxatilis TaxID=31220 RepID=UPI0038B4939F